MLKEFLHKRRVRKFLEKVNQLDRVQVKNIDGFLEHDQSLLLHIKSKTYEIIGYRDIDYYIYFKNYIIELLDRHSLVLLTDFEAM